MTVLKTLAVIFILGLIGGGLVVYSGIYNIAAAQQHTTPVEWLIVQLKRNSVRYHASAVKVPSLDMHSMERGAYHYHQLCAPCHGAPSLSEAEIARGLYPEPPDLTTISEIYSDRELFWITLNGLKMTGMPGFEAVLEEDELWDIVVFLKSLPEISPDQYWQIIRSQGLPLSTQMHRPLEAK